MKHYTHILLTAVALLVAGTASAQMKTSYFMESSVQRLDMNAGFIPQRGYVNIPCIGNFGVGYSTNYLSVRNFLYPNPDGDGLVTFMHGSVDADKFLRRLHNKNHFNADVRENIIGFGGFARRYFWSFGINVRSETAYTVPKDFFRIAKMMEPGEYDLDGFNVNSDNYLEFAVGFVFPVYKGINAGFRVKALAGAAQTSVEMQNMHVSMTDEEWRANMSGTISGNVAGFDFSKLKGPMTVSEIQDALNGSFDMGRIGSWGLAFDLGADARLLNDRLKVSLGVNDIGFISWSKKSAINGTIKDISVAYKGYDFDKDEVDFEKPDDVTIDVADPRSSTRMLTATLNVGGEYTFLENAIGLGVLSQTRFYGNYTSTNITLSANFRPGRWFSASISHSMLHNRIGAFGLALNVHPSWINLFLGMDYIGFNYAKAGNFDFVPLNLKSVNFYFGLGIPLSRPKECGLFSMTRR